MRLKMIHREKIAALTGSRAKLDDSLLLPVDENELGVSLELESPLRLAEA